MWIFCAGSTCISKLGEKTHLPGHGNLLLKVHLYHIFIYSCSVQLISFEIFVFIVYEHEYKNMCPTLSIIQLMGSIHTMDLISNVQTAKKTSEKQLTHIMIIFLLTIFQIRYVIKFLHSAAAWRYTFTKDLHEHIVSIPVQGFSERVVSVHYICLYCIPTAKNLLNFFFTVNTPQKNHFLISRNRKSKHFLKWKDKDKQCCTAAR